MKSVDQIVKKIEEIEKQNAHVLTGDLSTIVENAPRALMQLAAESKLNVLYWVIGKKFESKLRKR